MNLYALSTCFLWCCCFPLCYLNVLQLLFSFEILRTDQQEAVWGLQSWKWMKLVGWWERVPQVTEYLVNVEHTPHCLALSLCVNRLRSLASPSSVFQPAGCWNVNLPTAHPTKSHCCILFGHVVFTSVHYSVNRGICFISPAALHLWKPDRSIKSNVSFD